MVSSFSAKIMVLIERLLVIKSALPATEVWSTDSADASTSSRTAIPFDSKQSAGQEVTLTIHTWSDYPGDDEILSVIHPKILNAISRSPIDVGENLGVMLARLDTEETIQEPDGRIRQGIIRLRFRIMEV